MYNPRLHFHFVGIGGAGMSGIAEVLLQEGFRVSGSDAAEGEVTRRLANLGATIYLGHAAENVPEGASVVVYSSAVSLENAEIVAAKGRGIAVVRRAEVLAELMRLKFGVAVAGSHGKTTTTSFVAAVLELGGFDPTVIIGGKLESLSSGGKRGKGQYLVAETDESDRSFLLMKPTISVVTNIDAEHLSAYGSLPDLVDAFEQFATSVPFYGLMILCADDPQVRSLRQRISRRVVTYGVTPGADIEARDITCSGFSCGCQVWVRGEYRGDITIQWPARHLLVNSLAAVAVGVEFGVPFEAIAKAIGSVKGIERRLQRLTYGEEWLVISDYAHHPTEISATLKALREGIGAGSGRILVVFQPHRYSRTRDCFAQFLDAFGAADKVWITDVYSAGEEPIAQLSGEMLAKAIRHSDIHFEPSARAAIDHALSEAQAGDIVACLGAGSIHGIACGAVTQVSTVPKVA